MKFYSSVVNPASKTGNVGDTFAFNIAKHFLKNEICKIGTSQKEIIDERTLILIGSILGTIPRERKCHIYGPGFISFEQSAASVIGNNIHAVRGYLSWEKCKSKNISPGISSDPGLLCRIIYPELSESVKTQSLGLIVHSVDRELFFKTYPNLLPYLIDNYSNTEKFLSSLSKCKYIATTSLHGAVFSHALGIPCGVFEVSGNITGKSFKYIDYFSSLGIDFKSKSFNDIGNSIDDYIHYANAYVSPAKALIDNLIQKQLYDIGELISELNEESHYS